MTFGTQPQAGSSSTLESVRFIEVAQGQPQVVGSEGVVAAPYDSLQKCMCESVVTTVGVPCRAVSVCEFEWDWNKERQVFKEDGVERHLGQGSGRGEGHWVSNCKPFKKNKQHKKTQNSPRCNSFLLNSTDKAE